MQQSFSQWLRDQAGREDEVGTFAAKAAELPDLPEHGGKPIFDGYFQNTLQSDAASYERAWDEFQAVPNPGGARSES
ncbi:MAG TPA: hypothetical protein VIL55_02060 [Naasia sp.]|jgi:hypothetical protein